MKCSSNMLHTQLDLKIVQHGMLKNQPPSLLKIVSPLTFATCISIILTFITFVNKETRKHTTHACIIISRVSNNSKHRQMLLHGMISGFFFSTVFFSFFEGQDNTNRTLLTQIYNNHNSTHLFILLAACLHDIVEGKRHKRNLL